MFINTKGEIVIPCVYDGAFSFSEGLTMVKQNDKWGYVNTKGEIAIPCVYDDANYFFEGLAKVKQNGKWMIIDSNGQVIIPECDMSATSWSKVE